VEQELVHDELVGELHVRFFQEVAVQDRSLLLLEVFVRAILSVDPIDDAEEVGEHHERHILLLPDALELELRPLRRHPHDWHREVVRLPLLLMFSAEVSHSSFTQGTFYSMMTDSKNEGAEVFDRGPVFLEVEEVDLLPATLADEELNPSLPVVVEEVVDADV